ncbi:hypothetical protein KSF_084250 [Reticulibacter mediterranei]|uniref:Uncharacterized protein n=1 Tax=Reticulibacter mediterranei TaxID=2778369 RepID=A0A8J3N4M9_9CHLR|nr:hypothetical protein KSF_084250 [Reticulibacter mediterranei]
MGRVYKPTLPITPALDKILFTLSGYHLLTEDLVVSAVGSPGSASTVKANIKKLVEASYLYRFPLATIAGRSPFVCVLADQGMKYLRDERGLEIAFYKHPSEWKAMSSNWLMHPLELNKFIIAAHHLPDQSDVRVASFEHDYLIKSNPLVYLDEKGKAHGVIADAIINFAVPKRRVVWVELERDSHSKKAFGEKFTNIYWIIAKGIFENRYHAELVKVCFVSTVDDEHIAWMRMIARQALHDITQGHVNPISYRNRLFHFACVPPLQGEEIKPLGTFIEPYWMHPYDLECEKGMRYPLIEL